MRPPIRCKRKGLSVNCGSSIRLEGDKGEEKRQGKCVTITWGRRERLPPAPRREKKDALEKRRQAGLIRLEVSICTLKTHLGRELSGAISCNHFILESIQNSRGPRRGAPRLDRRQKRRKGLTEGQGKTIEAVRGTMLVRKLKGVIISRVKKFQRGGRGPRKSKERKSVFFGGESSEE